MREAVGIFERYFLFFRRWTIRALFSRKLSCISTNQSGCPVLPGGREGSPETRVRDKSRLTARFLYGTGFLSSCIAEGFTAQMFQSLRWTYGVPRTDLRSCRRPSGAPSSLRPLLRERRSHNSRTVSRSSNEKFS